MKKQATERRPAEKMIRTVLFDIGIYEVLEMKKTLVSLISVFLVISFVGCSGEATVKETFDDGLKTYYEMSDGAWTCDGLSYEYRLEICGRMPNAAKDSCFVYLSNREEISFEQAYMAAGLSSNSNDYFPPEEAVLVEWR